MISVWVPGVSLRSLNRTGKESPSLYPELTPLRFPCHALDVFAHPSIDVVLAMTYGPTRGPPGPTGAAPEGVTAVVDVSAMARAKFTRPLPVWAGVPAGSALRASRP